MNSNKENVRLSFLHTYIHSLCFLLLSVSNTVVDKYKKSLNSTFKEMTDVRNSVNNL